MIIFQGSTLAESMSSNLDSNVDAAGKTLQILMLQNSSSCSIPNLAAQKEDQHIQSALFQHTRFVSSIWSLKNVKYGYNIVQSLWVMLLNNGQKHVVVVAVTLTFDLLDTQCPVWHLNDFFFNRYKRFNRVMSKNAAFATPHKLRNLYSNGHRGCFYCFLIKL